jgi:hypothetical protein
MKFVVTCLDGGGFRVLASRSKVFTSLKEAIQYGGTVAEERKAEVIPVVVSEVAAEALFLHVVEHHQDLILNGDPEEVKVAIRYEGTDTLTVAFLRDHGVAFHSDDFILFSNELERLILEA